MPQPLPCSAFQWPVIMLSLVSAWPRWRFIRNTIKRLKMSTQRLAEMIRVDHAGEHGAVRIYDGQLAIFGKVKGMDKTADLIRHMAEQEQEHLNHFDKLIVERQVRPT